MLPSTDAKRDSAAASYGYMIQIVHNILIEEESVEQLWEFNHEYDRLTNPRDHS